jgi:glycosyltransferase involved in cell wall biosynthesis
VVSTSPDITLRVSGIVIARNEERSIGQCLRSMESVCDDMLVVDSHSTDKTREIAQSLGARVIERDWPGYRSQREFAIAAASHDWILMLDADESLSPALCAEILALKQDGGLAANAGWYLPLCLRYYGRKLRFGDAATERHLRLFDRRQCHMSGYEIHEQVKTDGRLGRLRGALLHDSYADYEHQKTKLALYASLMVEARHKAGKRGRLVNVLVNPPWRFFRAYVLRLGFLDGWRGFAMAAADASYVRQKYLGLYLRRRAEVSKP